MKIKDSLHTLLMGLLLASAAGYTLAVPYLQDNRGRRGLSLGNAQRRLSPPASARQTPDDRKPSPAVQPILVDEDTIPDSLLNTRWKIQRTTPVTFGDLHRNALDLQRPDNM